MTPVVLIGPALIVLVLRESFGRWLASIGLSRPNYAGRPIPTGYGLLLLMASLPFCAMAFLLPTESAAAARVAATALAFGGLGFIDDRWGDRSVGGLKGHFRALVAERRLTTGALKALCGAWTALILAATLQPAGFVDLLVSAALIALAANSLNLVDTRPMRAIALFYLGTAASMSVLMWYGAGTPMSFWAVPGAVAAYVPAERARDGMLGDSGANLLGALVGLELAMALPLWGRAALVVLLVAFHVFTERVSLNAYIEKHPFLRRIDRWIQGPA